MTSKNGRTSHRWLAPVALAAAMTTGVFVNGSATALADPTTATPSPTDNSKWTNPNPSGADPATWTNPNPSPQKQPVTPPAAQDPGTAAAAAIPDAPQSGPRPDNRPRKDFWHDQTPAQPQAPVQQSDDDAVPADDTPASTPSESTVAVATTLHLGTTTQPIPDWLSPALAAKWNEYNDHLVDQAVIDGDNLGLSKEDAERRAQMQAGGAVTGALAGAWIGAIPATIVGAVGGAAVGALIGAAALGIPTAGVGIPVGAGIGAWLGMTAGSVVGFAGAAVGALAGGAIGAGLGGLYASTQPLQQDPAPQPVDEPGPAPVEQVSAPVETAATAAPVVADIAAQVGPVVQQVQDTAAQVQVAVEQAAAPLVQAVQNVQATINQMVATPPGV